MLCLDKHPKMSFNILRSIYFLIFFSNFLNTFASPKRQLCRPDQRNALLEFKSEFKSSCTFSTSSPKTESWANKSDCCDWDGITCEAGKVIELDLSLSCFQGQLNSKSSLFKLQNLRVLNLAYNDFSSSMIPTQVGTLVELTRLNFSNSWLSGRIPKELLHLTKLVSLDLYCNSLSAEKSFLSKLSKNLTNLEELNLGLVDISSEIPQNMLNLSSLKSLSLEGCNLFGKLPSNLLLIPTMQSIDLNTNPDLEGSLPDFNGIYSLVLLDLSLTSLSGNIPNSIHNLKHLMSLTLHDCYFSGTIPSSLGKLYYLSSLDLSYNLLYGQIPSSIGNLVHLTHLKLSSNRFDGQIPFSFVNLKKLTRLHLDSNKLSGNFPLPLLNLTMLSTLSLIDNQFRGTIPPNINVLSNLKTFEASHNTFNGTLPSGLFTIPTLTSIDLRDNQLNDFSEFGNSSSPSKLERLLLGRNHFKGSIPISISKLVNLDDLDLSYFNTGMALNFGIFSQLKRLINLDIRYLNTTNTVDLSIIFSNLKHLSTLDLSGEHVSTTKMVSSSNLHLGRLFLSGCGITEFPKFVRNLQHMSDLDLSNNNIKGQVPQWIWKLPLLMSLNLSTNSFTSLERSSNDSSRAEILMLDLSSNKFQGRLVIPPLSSTEALLVSKNNFTGKIPRSICRLSFLSVIDLSNNNFIGSIPRCLESLNNYLSVINLSYNQLSGNIPEIFTNATELNSLDVNHNRLVGRLPRSLQSCSGLGVLNVGNNIIDDTFPFWLKSLRELQVLVLRNNKFNGLLYNLPRHSFGFPKLQIIDISNNYFTGDLPSYYFADWNMTTRKDFSGFNYIGDGSYYHDSMVLMSKGVEMKLERIFTLLTAIDFSGNRLQGKIPESIGLLKDLVVLNFSSNGFTSNIPSSLASLTQLESLDLSHNKLSGQIPHTLGDLTSLSTITMSHNKLFGPIPQTAQFQTQSASSFEENLGLCGLPLQENCGDVDRKQSKVSESEEEEEEDGVLSWTAAAIGFAPGVILGLTIAYIVITFKPQWFVKKHKRSWKM